jgi:16S rRNA (guanine527-N7)-methyltransferase
MRDRAQETWNRVLEELGGAEPPEKLREYVEELVIWGARIHLTGREKMEGAIAAQISDSLLMLELAGDGGDIADIGAGAGFPGVVWKLMRPRWRVTLFERKQRLASFLARTAAVLELEGISVIAEDAARYQAAGGFDVVTSKAAGRLGEVLPLVAGLLRSGGIYVTAKGEGWESEMYEGSGFSLAGRIPLGGGRGEAISLVPDREET